ncbi:DoxX family protein [Caballeronia sp. SBC2]|uniref:DoxX family protein n=1 Tax=Caballeronia sp. SBC2 TaxID=2705547 RepID=UPI001F1507B9|nr:DoxX family protein [Caballeronia sp. SBC2]
MASRFSKCEYPRWWSRFTGGLQMMSAVLIALPVSRIVGLALGAVIIAAAVLTDLRHREFTDLAPLGVFVAVIVLAGWARWSHDQGSRPISSATKLERIATLASKAYLALRRRWSVYVSVRFRASIRQ